MTTPTTNTHITKLEIVLFHTWFCRAKETHANVDLHIEELAGNGDFTVCTITPVVMENLSLRIEATEEGHQAFPGLADKYVDDSNLEGLKVIRDRRSFWDFWGLQFANYVNFTALTRALRLDGWLIATTEELKSWLENASQGELDAAFQTKDEGEDFDGANSITADWYPAKYGDCYNFGAWMAESDSIDEPIQSYGAVTSIFGYRVLMRKIK